MNRFDPSVLAAGGGAARRRGAGGRPVAGQRRRGGRPHGAAAGARAELTTAEFYEGLWGAVMMASAAAAWRRRMSWQRQQRFWRQAACAGLSELNGSSTGKPLWLSHGGSRGTPDLGYCTSVNCLHISRRGCHCLWSKSRITFHGSKQHVCRGPAQVSLACQHQPPASQRHTAGKSEEGHKNSQRHSVALSTLSLMPFACSALWAELPRPHPPAARAAYRCRTASA